MKFLSSESSELLISFYDVNNIIIMIVFVNTLIRSERFCERQSFRISTLEFERRIRTAFFKKKLGPQFVIMFFKRYLKTSGHTFNRVLFQTMTSTTFVVSIIHGGIKRQNFLKSLRLSKFFEYFFNCFQASTFGPNAFQRFSLFDIVFL